MAYRLVQAGSGDPRPLVVLYLVGSGVDADLREALGSVPAIVAFDDAVGEALPQTIARVQSKLGAAVSDVAICGFSAGCQAVRRELIEGQDPSVVVTMDGTHASLPPADWQLQVWRDFASRARRSERLFVATCTQNTYVENELPKDQRYSATVSVLRLVTGFSLKPAPAPSGEHDGELHVYSFTSETTDKAAHGRQQTVALPDVLLRHVRPWLMARMPLSKEERTSVQQAVDLSLDRLARDLDRESERAPKAAV